MDERLQNLLEAAYRQVPAQEANEAIARERVREGEARPQRSYEMVLTSFDAFARELLPKLVYHLESIGAHLPECAGVTVAAFAGERLYFLEARSLVASACALLGVTPETLVALHGTGESRTAITLPEHRN